MTSLWKFSFIILILLAPLPATAQLVHQEWVQSQPGHYYVGTKAMDLDADGNVYVVGYQDMDFLTIKYNPDGDFLWEIRFNCGENTWDRASAIAVDNLGNVVVSGHSFDFDEEFGSYVTVKYGPDGSELWVAKFDELDADISGESGNYLALDSWDNVYLTGKVRGDDDFDFVTIKYNAAGLHQWTSLFDGNQSGNDSPSDIATDEFGTVYVTGTSQGQDGLFDYATIKYGPDGEECWRSRIANNLEHWYHQCRMDVCPEGGVVVVGGLKWGPQYDDCDFLTTKYFPNGDVAWTNIYTWPQEDWYEFDYANAVVVDDVGNVIVTGASMDVDTYYDYATVKYSFDGEMLWTARFSGLGGYDWPTAIALDDLGNIYVTGMMELWFSTVKYGPGGDQLWSVFWEDPGLRYDAMVHDIKVDAQHNVYLQGQNNYSGLTTIKYSQGPLAPVEPESHTNLRTAGRLWQNHPNPFNPHTTIRFDLLQQGEVTLRIFDLAGRLVDVLLEGVELPAGVHTAIWNGRTMPSGIYFCRMDVGEFTETKRMTLVR